MLAFNIACACAPTEQSAIAITSATRVAAFFIVLLLLPVGDLSFSLSFQTAPLLIARVMPSRDHRYRLLPSHCWLATYAITFFGSTLVTALKNPIQSDSRLSDQIVFIPFRLPIAPFESKIPSQGFG